MHKVVVVDIGTHRAQEFRAAFVTSSVRAGAIALRHAVRLMLERRRIPVTWAGFHAYATQRELLKRNRKNFFCILVEPNQHLFRLPIYQKADAAFNVALSNDAEKVSVVPLYLAHGNLTGQGSSLYTGKPNADPNNSLTALNVDVEHFARELNFTSIKPLPPPPAMATMP